ncbi:Hsp20/alpha crystallin family protein [Candidatus Woesearchaeota archaeon]|nr:MAG: Hsp20/alpha crystallin family protein [Candidatus Woesearchaeota archaeon]
MVQRWNIWDDLRRMQSEMERLFGDLFAREAWGGVPQLTGPGTDIVSSNYRQALMDLSETDSELVATVELPGVEKKDIQINATDDGVEIKVEKKDEKEEKKKGMYRLERSYAGFYRFIPVPDGVDIDNIKASYKNGVLELRMPKVESKRKAKRISVD